MGEFQSLSKLLRKYVEDGLPGCGIIIAKHGEILFEEYVGWSDVESRSLCQESPSSASFPFKNSHIHYVDEVL